jgi:hypothetical protein
MKRKLILVSASVFAISGVIHLAHARDFVDFSELCGTTVDTDTQVKRSGDFNIADGCKIEVLDAKLEVVGVKVAVAGDLEIDDVSSAGSGKGSELVFRNAYVTTAKKVKIEGLWDGGVVFRNNQLSMGDDLRIKPTGLGDLTFRNNHGDVEGDIRLGDSGLQGDINARNNVVAVMGDFRAASTDGDIAARNNKIRNEVGKVQITSDGSGDVSVKHNSFENSDADQEVEITSEDGDVAVLNNNFGQFSVSSVMINSTNGQCESERNRPDDVNTLACPL